MEIEVQASRENIPVLLAFIEQACQEFKLSRQTCLNLQLVVEEACINIVTHGYEGLPPGTISVTFQFKDQQVLIIITDFGHRFDPTTYPPPDIISEWDKRPVGGLGAYLINKLMDGVHYTSDTARGNRLELTKNIK